MGTKKIGTKIPFLGRNAFVLLVTFMFLCFGSVAYANDPPTDISLSNNTVPENEPADTTVGTFTTVDPDSGDSHTYSLVAGPGDTNNASFAIVGGQLQTAAAFNYEDQNSYSIRVRSTDSGIPAEFFEEQFTIDITDVNEAPTAATDTLNVSEDAPNDTIVGQVSASDPDGDALTYSITAGNDDSVFAINSNGQITVSNNANLDAETTASYILTVLVEDNDPTMPLSGEATITIDVTDANDPPTDISLSNNTVPENEPADTTVGTFTTVDPDSGDSHTYSLVAGPGDTNNASFAIVGGQLQTAAAFNYEDQNSYSIRVRSTDSGIPAEFFEEQFTIDITDVNEAPTAATDTLNVSEDAPNDTIVGQVSASDPDGDALTYSITAGNDDSVFAINSNGQITVSNNANLDAETTASYILTVLVEDNDPTMPLSGEATITIDVTDANDPPTDISLSNNTVPENEPADTTVGTFTTVDPDSGDSHTYSLVAGPGDTNNASFAIVGGQLQTAAAFNYEDQNSYSIRVRSTDSGIPAEFFEEQFTIDITDVNEAPTAATDTLNVSEDAPNDTIVGQVSASDPDGDALTYSITAGNDDSVFAINSNGQITVSNNANLDAETTASYILTVLVEDNDPTMPLSGEATITIDVTDANDPPTDISLSNNTVPENEPADTTVGTFTTVDPDSGDSHTYSLLAGPGDTNNASFAIVGGQLQTAAAFNYEDQNSYSIRVRSTDSGIPAEFFEEQFTIDITDVNEAPTAATDTLNVSEDAPNDTIVGQVSASDPDGDALTYSITAGNDDSVFAINSNGQITVSNNANLDAETTASYILTVLVEDNDPTMPLSGEATITIDVTDANDPPTDISLSNNTVPENEPADTTVGTFTTVDPDSGDSHTYSLVAGPGDTNNASFAIVGGQLQTAAAFNYEDQNSYSIRVRSTDSGIPAEFFEEQFTIDITDVNDPPTSADNTVTTDEDTAYVFAASDFNFTDSDTGDTLNQVQITSLESAGDLKHNGSDVASDGVITKSDIDAGLLTFEPAVNASGTPYDSFQFKVHDGTDYSDLAYTMTVNVDQINDPPVAINDIFTVFDTSGPVTLDIIGGTNSDSQVPDNDPDHILSSLVIDILGPLLGAGNLENNDTNVTYTPGATSSGTETFTYTLRDPLGAISAEATVSINVIDIEETPTPYDDYLTMQEDSTSSVWNVANANPLLSGTPDDLGDEPSTFHIVINVEHGVLNVDTDGVNFLNNGTFTYTPDPDWYGEETFTYRIKDIDNDESMTATVRITVLNEDDPPVARIDSFLTVEEDVPFTTGNVLDDNGSGADELGDTPSTISTVDDVDNGTLTWNPELLGGFTYVPNSNYHGYDGFTYRITDFDNDTSDAIVSIEINPLPDAPVANGDNYTVAEGGTLNITDADGTTGDATNDGVLVNDTDADLDSLSASLKIGDGPSNGEVTLNLNGTFTYTHYGTETTTDSFVYVADDGNGGTCQATVNIIVTPVNDPPVAYTESYSVDEDGGVLLANDLDGTSTPTNANDNGVLVNDTDAEGDSLEAILVAGPSHDAMNGFNLNSDGTFFYIPEADFYTTVDITESFTYKANDGQDSLDVTVTIEVNSVNDPPVAIGDNYTVAEGGTLNANDAAGTTGDATDDGVLANDTDVEGDTLTAIWVSGPTNAADFVLNSDGTFSYEHDGTETTTDSFEYKANDGGQDSEHVTVTITVGEVNDPPVASDDSYTVAEGGTLNANDAAGTTGDATDDGVLANDTDAEGDTLTAIWVSGPTNAADFVLNSDGTFSYEHDGTETTTDSFEYKANDGGQDSEHVTVTITVGEVNDPPVASDDSYTVAEGGTLNANDAAGTTGDATDDGVLANDTDAEGDTLTAIWVSGPTNAADFVLNSDGTFSYEHDGTETTTDSFEYKANDGGQDSEHVTVTITVGEVNDPPVASDDSYTVAEGETLNANDAAGTTGDATDDGVLANDTDAEGDTLTAIWVSGPTNAADFVLNSDGTFSYEHDGTETTTDSFEYKANDGGQDSEHVTVTITVGEVNDPPVAHADSYNVAEGETLNTTDADGTSTPTNANDNGVLANDTDAEGDSLVAGFASIPANGQVTLYSSGNFLYEPDDNFSGEDTFTYDISDGNGGTDSATVTINVENIDNDPPNAGDDAFDVDEGSSNNSLDGVLNNDSDPDDPNEILSITSVDNISNLGGTVTINANDDGFVYTPPTSNFAGSDSFEYTISDSTGLTDSATVTITVENIDSDPPNAEDDFFMVDEGSIDNPLNVLTNDSDPDPGDTENLTITAVDNPGSQGGTVTITSDDKGLLYTPPQPDFTETETFQYEISDGNGGTDTALVTVNVGPLNFAPTFTSTPGTGATVGVAYNYRVTATDDNVGDVLVITADTLPDWMTLTDAGEGKAYLFGTPDSAYIDDHLVELTVSDGQSADIQVFTISVYDAGISQSNWSLWHVDSEELDNAYKPATNAFDEDSSTIWHTEWYNSPLPHEIQIDLGALHDINGFNYLPRQDRSNGRIKDYEFYVSLDGENWGSPVVTGTFENTPAAQERMFTQVTGQYIRLVALSEVFGNPWTTVAELNILGALHSGFSNNPPVGSINLPTQNLTIAIMESVYFAGIGMDPDDDTPLTYLWDFDDPLIEDSMDNDVGLVQFNTAGTFTVTFNVFDAFLLPDPNPATVKITVVSGSGIIPQDNWELQDVDSEELINTYKPAVYAFDGNASTFWHTEWYNSPLPHEIQIDLGDLYDIDGLRYLPRQVGSNGRIKDYEFYVSLDGVSWGSPVDAGEFLNTPAEQERMFTQVTGRYVRLVALSEVNGEPWTAVAELNILGVPFNGSLNYPPDGIIDDPAVDMTITVGQSLNFAGTGTDPDEDNTLLTYHWNFGDTTINESTEAIPGQITFNNVGTYEVTFTVTDSMNLPDPTPAIRNISVEFDSYDLPRDNWSVLHVDSEELIGTYKPAIYTFDGDPDTIWHTEWYESDPPCPHEIQIYLGGIFDIDGFRYLPRQISSNGRIKDYEFYVSLDGENWGSPVVTGTFENTTAAQERMFTRIRGQFIRFVALSEVNGNPWTSMAELDIIGAVPTSSMAIIPNTVTVAVSGTQSFSAIDGEPPYTFSLVENNSGGSIDPDTGLYTAGPTGEVTDTVSVTDSTLARADALVQVAGPVEIVPEDAYVAVSGIKNFNASGGALPYIFSLKVNNSGGSIDPDTGLYTAGSISGVNDIVKVRDLLDSTAEAIVTIINMPVAITPTAANVSTGSTLQFYATGGEPPYTFSLVENNSGGSIDLNTGLYTAGPTIGAIDRVLVEDTTHDTAQTTVTVTDVYLPIDQTSWMLLYVDSEELVGTNKPATNAFDGDPTTIWHTEWYEADPEHPHEIQIDLGDFYEIDGFTYLPRQDLQIGRIGFYEFYVTTDTADWGNPVATGFFTRDFEEQEVIFSRSIGRYIRLVALDEINGGPYTTMAELNVLGALFSGQIPPESVIDTPDKNQTIFAGDSVTFGGTGVESGGSLPLNFEWNFNDQSIPNMYVEDPGPIQFDIPGIYTVTFTVSDADLNADITPATRIIKVLDPISDVTISQNVWALTSVDSEELIGTYKPAIYSFDGDPTTFWHTEWYESDPPPPHEILIDLGSAYLIDSFRYLPRQNSINGRIADYHFFVSDDGKNWGSSVASGTFINSYEEKKILFNSKWGQFIRLIALSEVNGNPWTSMAELNLEGECNTPYVRIIDPKTDDIMQGPDLNIRTSVCLNLDEHDNWGVKFIVDEDFLNAQIIPFPADGVITSDTFTFTEPGVGMGMHKVEVIIVDDQEIEQTANDIATNVAVGDYYVAIGDSITAGIMDDYPDDNVSQDGRNAGQGFPTVLNDLLTSARGYPHSVVNEGLTGEKTSGGLARLPSVLKRYPNAGYFLISWGANDSISGGLLPLPSGLGLFPGDDGYAGSYKDLFQQMITLVRDAGKVVYLAEVLYSQVSGSAEDFIEYNNVIHELCTENSILVEPPPFYDYFEANQNELIDGTHPTGIGYRSIANLWFNEINP